MNEAVGNYNGMSNVEGVNARIKDALTLLGDALKITKQFGQSQQGQQMAQTLTQTYKQVANAYKQFTTILQQGQQGQSPQQSQQQPAQQPQQPPQQQPDAQGRTYDKNGAIISGPGFGRGTRPQSY